VAVYCWVVPLAMDAPVGVTAIEERVAAVTVSTEVSLTEPTVAVMVVVPTARVEALPRVPAALDTVAMDGTDELQVACSVRSWVESSL